jgi:hypothetical protein
MHHITTFGVLEPACVRCFSPLAAARCIPPDVPIPSLTNRALCFHHVPRPAERAGERRPDAGTKHPSRAVQANASSIEQIPFSRSFPLSFDAPTYRSAVPRRLCLVGDPSHLAAPAHFPRQVTRISACRIMHTRFCPFTTLDTPNPESRVMQHEMHRRRLWLCATRGTRASACACACQLR